MVLWVSQFRRLNPIISVIYITGVFNNLLDYKMRDKNICIFAGMSNERDDPGTPDPEPAKEGTTKKEPAKKAAAAKKPAKKATREHFYQK